MKQVFLIASLFALFAMSSATATMMAQDSSSGSDQMRKLPTPEEVVAKLDSKLSLTDDQKAKITPIIADRQQQLKAAATENTRRFKKARKMKSIYQDSDKKIKALLTDDQKKKYEALEQEMREKMKDRRQQAKNNSD